MKVIELRGIQRSYTMMSKGAAPIVVPALSGIDISVGAGDFLSIMGPSGSGKSTLMHILGCLDKPSSGTYLLEGIETSCSSPDTFARIRNRKIGFVFQAFNLLSRTTALENVELPLWYNRSIPRRNWKERAVSCLREVGLENRMGHFPAQLSGGQQQRVAIARALVNDPAFILADEPTGNLDTGMSLEIMGLFQALNEQGKTIIMVTHEPELAAYTKRVITLRDGKILADYRIAQQGKALEDLAQWKQNRDREIKEPGGSVCIS
ncbi:MAG: ABC transporter ATP-binding protein [Treponema sp.]|jgi:putative ABC transport system ATP-binding protein|nr:ABC transporter ATP-binding protein [Treponema sp.]